MIAGIEAAAIGDRITGTSRYITCLIDQLNNLDDEVKTFSVPDSKIISLVGKKGLQKFLYRRFLLSKEMISSKIDYAFFPDYFMPPDFTIPSAIVIHDLSFISHPHFYSKSFVSFYNYQLKRTLKNNPLVLTISENTRTAIEKYLGIKKESIRLLQAYSQFGNCEINPGQIKENYLLYVGHIEPKKNLYFLIKTFLKWKESAKADLKLVIAGEYWIKNDETRKIMSEFRNREDIQLKGYVDEESLKKLYERASGFVNASFVEGFCLPVLEAMHFNLPVLCSFNTGAEEISKPNSIIVNPYSEKSLIGGFDRLYDVINSGHQVNYDIKYSPSLMKIQLIEAVDILKSKSRNKIITHIPKANNKEEAVEKTLLYSSLFNSGIKNKDLLKSIFEIRISKDQLENVLLKLRLENKIYFKDDAIFLNYTRRTFNNKQNGNTRKNRFALRILNFIPFISSASLSGGTTHNGYENHDDVDLFIITKPNALYIVYALIHVLSLIFKVRKELCANYLIDEREMEIKHPHDFYTAHQIISLSPVKNSKQLCAFFSHNKWISKFFPNFLWDNIKSKNSFKNFHLIPLNKSLKLFYRLIYKKQLRENYNGTSVILDEYAIKLHTNDNRQKITEEFLNTWNEYKSGTLLYSQSKDFNKQAAV